MNTDNPIVQDTVPATLTEIVHVLQYLAKTLPDPSQENDAGIATYELSRQELAGLRHLIGCAQMATQACYEQYQREKT